MELLAGGRTAQTYNTGEMKLVQIKSTKASTTSEIYCPSILKSHMKQKTIQCLDMKAIKYSFSCLLHLWSPLSLADSQLS